MTTVPGTEPVVRVRDLRKSFKDLHVLRGVDLEVARAASSRCSAPTAQARPPS